MKTRKKPTERNWVLVFISSILILLGPALVILAVMNVSNFGWWSLIIGFGGLSTCIMAITSIIRNDPSWILLDLIIPG